MLLHPAPKEIRATAIASHVRLRYNLISASIGENAMLAIPNSVPSWLVLRRGNGPVERPFALPPVVTQALAALAFAFLSLPATAAEASASARSTAHSPVEQRLELAEKRLQNEPENAEAA